LASHTSLTFFPSSLYAGLAAIHTFSVSLLFVFKKMLDIKKSPTARSRAVRPIGYFAVLQDAEQISVPAVHYAETKRIPPGLRCGSLGG